MDLLRFCKAALAASRLVGGSVLQQNPDVLDLAAECLEKKRQPILFGVKNTAQIQREYLRRMLASGSYVWHTIDAMAEGGRAVDMKIVNPLTGKPMTGSSSATALHVLLGINDVGIGSDGGGSLLAPALSLNLCSIMGKGLGLVGTSLRKSTDEIAFLPGVGAISHSMQLAAETVLLMCNMDIEALGKVSLAGYKAVIPASHFTLPDGSDMRQRLTPAVKILQDNGIEIAEQSYPDCMNRSQAIDWLSGMLADCELIISFEGPIDMYGLGDTVFGGWGTHAARSQAVSGKYLLKVANMADTTAITIPAGDAATGIVIIARSGIDAGLAAISLGLKLAAAFPPPPVFESYFRASWHRRANDLIFSI